MPNTGRPSRDCHECRKKRVKCDLTRPQCRRCTRQGKTCPGYRDEIDLLFRHESSDQYAANPSRDRRRTGHATSSTRTSRSGSSGTETTAVQVPQLQGQHLDFEFDEFYRQTWPSSPRSLPESYDTHFVPLVLSLFSCSFNVRNHRRAVDFMPEMFLGATEHSPLLFVSDAVARAYWTGKYGAITWVAQCSESYGRALSATNAALRDPKVCTDDSSIVCVWLLGMYELLMGNPNANVSPVSVAWEAHIRGMKSLITLRGKHQFQSKTGQRIFWLIYNKILTRCFISDVEPPSESMDWFNTIKEHLAEEDMRTLQCNTLAYRAAVLNSKIHTAITTTQSAETPLQISALLAEAAALEQQILVVIEEGAERRQQAYREPMQQESLRIITSLHWYRSFQLKLHYSILKLIHFAEGLGQDPQATGTFDTQYHYSIATVQKLAGEILSDLPYLLAPTAPDPVRISDTRTRKTAINLIDAVRVLWPLRTICAWDAAREDQVKEAEAGLKVIASEIGLRQASAPVFRTASYSAQWRSRTVD